MFISFCTDYCRRQTGMQSILRHYLSWWIGWYEAHTREVVLKEDETKDDLGRFFAILNIMHAFLDNQGVG